VAKTPEGILAEVRPLRELDEITQISQDMKVRTQENKSRRKSDQFEIDRQAGIGRRIGAKRRLREGAELKVLQDKLKAELAQSIDHRLKEAAQPTRETDSGKQ